MGFMTSFFARDGVAPAPPVPAVVPMRGGAAPLPCAPSRWDHPSRSQAEADERADEAWVASRPVDEAELLMPLTPSERHAAARCAPLSTPRYV